jgi:hypothetical protein
MVSFTPLPLYLQGKSSRYPLDMRLGGPQSPSGCHGEAEKPLPPTGNLTLAVQPIVTKLTSWLDALTQCMKGQSSLFYRHIRSVDNINK